MRVVHKQSDRWNLAGNNWYVTAPCWKAYVSEVDLGPRKLTKQWKTVTCKTCLRLRKK